MRLKTEVAGDALPQHLEKEISMERFFAPRRQAGRLALAIGLGALLASSASGWAATPPAPGPDEAFGLQAPKSTFKAEKAVRSTPSEKAGIDLGTLPEVRLSALDKNALLKEDAVDQRRLRMKILRFGVGRKVQVSAANGNWYDLANGSHLWAAEIVSPDAVGLRLHFAGLQLPAGAELAVYAPRGASQAIAHNGYAQFDPDRKVDFYEGSAAASGDLWTRTFAGERVRVEYLAPAGAGRELPFRIDSLQHAYIDPVDLAARSLVNTKQDAGSCENDVTCHPEWADVARGVARIAFVEDGGGFLCSGQLLNDNAQDFTPYFLTANHCISTPQSAASAEFFWFYQTQSCNGNPPSVDSVPTSNGATLLSTSPTSDYTLMMVNGALPDDLYWVGWTGKTVPDGTDSTAIHHPSGDYKRISFGFKDQSQICNQDAGTNAIKLVRIAWTDGVTEGGSSGSGIFTDDTQQLFGQLFFGPSFCGADPQDLYDCYGAFTNTYTRIKKLLAGGSDDSSEQNDTCPKARVVRAGNLGNRIVKVNDPDWYRISVPAHKSVTVTVNFDNGNGDVDLAGYANCASDAITTSNGQDNSETITLTNDGSRPAFAYWQVFLSSSTRNNYSMSVSVHNSAHK
jgi:lysyl endopeptidase